MSLENGLCKQKQWKQQSAVSGKEEQGDRERMAVRFTQNNHQETLQDRALSWDSGNENFHCPVEMLGYLSWANLIFCASASVSVTFSF